MHTRVDGKMEVHLEALQIGERSQRPSVLRIRRGERYTVMCGDADELRRRPPEHENGAGEPRIPQLDGLLESCHARRCAPRTLERPHNHCGAVPVGVRLEHGHRFATAR